MSYDPLCTLDEFKKWIGYKPTEENQDEDIVALISALSRNIGEYCGRDNLGAIQTYSENRKLSSSGSNSPRILVGSYPVISLTSILYNNTSLAILTPQQLQQNTAGVFLEDDSRTLSFLGLWVPQGRGYVQINYTAGFQLNGAEVAAQATPSGLRQACIQWVGEILKSKGWIGYNSKSLGGETVSFEGGRSWGMSPRTKAMIQPYVNRMPKYY